LNASPDFIMREKTIGDLHVLTDTTFQDRFTHEALAVRAAAGGADVIQFREKRPRSTRALVETARAVVEAARGAGARVVVNDRADVAVEAGAVGVHLGREDLDPDIARRILGPEAILGATANSLEEALRVVRKDVDYLGVGPVFGTRSKADPARPLGLEGLQEIVEAVDKPVIAIGTLTPGRVAQVLDVGARGVAVLSAVVLDADPEKAARRFRNALDQYRRS